MNDVLLTYKNIVKYKREPDGISEIDKSVSVDIDDSNINPGIVKSSDLLILKKEKLVNEACRNFFANLLFDNQIEQSEKKDFDFYCSKYLLTMFGQNTIEEFNMNLFLESLDKVIPRSYYKIVQKRWISNQKYYLEEYDDSLKLLQEALQLAESSDETIAEWFIQDILIDLRNREISIGDERNEYVIEPLGQKGLNSRLEKLYYPLIDRNEKDLLEWIEKERQKNEMRSYSSWSSYGDLSILSNYIADIYYQAMMFGSLSHLNRIYSLIQTLTYQLSKFTDYWPWVMMLLNTTIMTLDYKKTTQVTSHFGKILEKMNSEDARKVYQFSNNAKPSQNQFIANLIAMSEIGYYLDDKDFEEYWYSLKVKIDSWVEDKNRMRSLQPYIFRCLKKISERINDNYILEFSLKILESSKKYYYFDTLKLLSGSAVNYDSIDANDSNRIVHTLIQCETEITDFNELELIKFIFFQLKNENSECQRKKEAFMEKKWSDFYSNEYMFEKNKNRKTGKNLIVLKTKSIHNRNLTQGKNGFHSGYTTNPYYEAERILTSINSSLEESVIDELFTTASDTIFSSNQLVDDKLKAYRLMIFLLRYDEKIKERKEAIMIQLIQFQDFEIVGESMMSSVDSTMLKLSHFLLLECLGKGKFTEIAEILSVFTEPGNQVEACKMLQVFLYNYGRYKIKANLESLLMQCSLLWSNSDNLDVRWHDINLQLKLIEKKKYRKLIGQNLQSIMDSDNAFVKSRIVHEINLINSLDEKLGKAILETAKKDNNYVIRKIVSLKN